MEKHHPTSFRFSHKAIENLPTPKDKPVEYSDQVAIGLRLYVGSTGSKRWRFRYRFDGKPCVISLGRFPSTPLEKARKLAVEKAGLLDEGIDPRLEKAKRQGCPTFSEFVTEVFVPYAIRERKGIKDDLNRLEKKLMPRFGDMKLNAIRKEHVAGMVEELASKISGTTANRTKALMSAVMEKAIDYGHVDANPTRRVRKCKEYGPRKTHLKDAEAARFHKVLLKEVEDCNLYAQALYLLFVTGMRKSSAYSLTWDQVDLDKGTIFLPDSKNGCPQIIPLNSLALKLLQDIQSDRGKSSNFIFPGSGRSGHITETRKTFKAIKARANVEHLRPHDLRRSFASVLANQGESLRNIGSLLGHRDLRTTEKVYAHLDDATLRTTSEQFVKKLKEL